jgi:hypothetical protein
MIIVISKCYSKIHLPLCIHLTEKFRGKITRCQMCGDFTIFKIMHNSHSMPYLFKKQLMLHTEICSSSFLLLICAIYQLVYICKHSYF